MRRGSGRENASSEYNGIYYNLLPLTCGLKKFFLKTSSCEKKWNFWVYLLRLGSEGRVLSCATIYLLRRGHFKMEILGMDWNLKNLKVRSLIWLILDDFRWFPISSPVNRSEIFWSVYSILSLFYHPWNLRGWAQIPNHCPSSEEALLYHPPWNFKDEEPLSAFTNIFPQHLRIFKYFSVTQPTSYSHKTIHEREHAWFSKDISELAVWSRVKLNKTIRDETERDVYARLPHSPSKSISISPSTLF